MAQTLHHPQVHRAAGRTAPVLSSREISWGIALLLAWLGWPVARDFIIWMMLRIYDWYISYIH